MECRALRPLWGSVVGLGQRLGQRGEQQRTRRGRRDGLEGKAQGSRGPQPRHPGEGSGPQQSLSRWAALMQGAWVTDILAQRRWHLEPTSGAPTGRQSSFVHVFVHSFHYLIFTEHLQRCQPPPWALEVQCEQDRHVCALSEPHNGGGGQRRAP